MCGIVACFNFDPTQPIDGHLIQQMTDTLAKGDRVEIRGLCSFEVKKYRAYKGRDPRTGKRIEVPPKKLPFFKLGRELKSRVNSK